LTTRPTKVNADQKLQDLFPLF